MVKVLHINTYDRAGGAEQFVVDFIACGQFEGKLLVKEKSTNNPAVAAIPRNVLDKGFTALDRLSHNEAYPQRLKTRYFLNEKLNFTASKISKHPFFEWADVLHLHNIHGGFFDIGALAKLSGQKPVVWSMHDMWAFTGGESYTFDSELYKTGKAHTPYIANYPLCSPTIDGRQRQLEEKKAVYNTLDKNFVFAPVSHWLENGFRSSYVFNPKLQVQTILNGIDTTLFKNKDNRTWQKPRVLFFNSPKNPFKGSAIFIDALSHINADFDLYVIGETVAGFKGVQIPLAHIKDRHLMCDIYNQVDFMVFPSLAENFSLTVLEAMACGVCVLASNIGGIPEQIDEDTGYLFNPHQGHTVYQTIDAALSGLQASRNKGAAASLKVNNKFASNAMYNQYDNIYKTLLKGN